MDLQESNAKFASSYLDVKIKSGNEWMSLCPFHDDSSPSFSFNISKGLYICYACGAKGNRRTLAKHFNLYDPKHKEHEVSITDVKNKITKLFGNTEDKVETNDVSKYLLQYRLGNQHLEEWDRRGINNIEVINSFQLGYSFFRNCLIIPIYNFHGKFEGVIERHLSADSNRKYKYPFGVKISDVLLGAWQVRCFAMTNRVKNLAIVEGSIDAFAMWQVGIPAVSILGSNFSDSQRKILQALDPQTLVIMTDMDTAGHKASFVIETKLKSSGIIVKRAKWNREDGKDPAELSPEKRIEIFNSVL